MLRDSGWTGVRDTFINTNKIPKPKLSHRVRVNGGFRCKQKVLKGCFEEVVEQACSTLPLMQIRYRNQNFLQSEGECGNMRLQQLVFPLTSPAVSGEMGFFSFGILFVENEVTSSLSGWAFSLLSVPSEFSCHDAGDSQTMHLLSKEEDGWMAVTLALYN